MGNSLAPQPYSGFFNFHYLPDADKIHLEITNLGEEFLYINSLSSGIGNNDIGLDRGQLGNERIVKFQRAGNKVLLVQPNYRYRSTSTNPLEQQSIEQAFAKSVLYGFPIVEEKDGRITVDLTPMLMEDAHGVSQRCTGSTGELSCGQKPFCHFPSTYKGVSKNVEFDVLLTFTGQPKVVSFAL